MECSVWSNGQDGRGIKVLGGPDVRLKNFDRKQGRVIVELDDVDASVNIDKNSFWNKTCGELINKQFRAFIARHNLNPSDRVWLKVLEPYRKYRVELV
jgi:hypothetical protein